MKIGIDARMYGAKATTGIGVYIKNLTDELFKIDQANHYVMFMKDPEFSKFVPPNQRVTKVKIDIPWYSLAEQLKLPKILAENKLDLVHFPQFNIPILYHGKYIVTIHDITQKLFPGPRVRRSFFRKLAFNLVFKCGIVRAKKIITVSNFTKNNLLKYYRANSKKIIVTHLGFNSNINTKINDERIFEFKKQLNINKPYLLYLGVWRDHKNLPALIQAFNLIKEKYQLNYQLVLAGQPDQRYPEIQAEIELSKFKNDIITPGFVPEADLPILYSAAKLFVLPSLAEGFGLVALESQSLGVPVAVSSTTSLPEILEDSAVYFDPTNINQMAEVINRIVNDSNLYDSLKQKGINQVKRYNWANTAKETLSVYQTI